MRYRRILTLWGLAIVLGISVSTTAQEESPKVQQDIATAKKAAGTQWAAAENLFCATEEQVAAMKILPSANANEPDEAVYEEPTRVFDNFVLRRHETGSDVRVDDVPGTNLVRQRVQG